ncbi:uncharacterized protein LOC125508529 isoform X2 [Triticum urartu]|uniref:uncharacterized protein LOC125508529 isoform X2 n=1 Tax=Triticum urartu TaxID=4572 RepID=UPI002043517E|nr:uncharacterized protein LOC125508529 isoform X2 [Triticum urartu]
MHQAAGSPLSESYHIEAAQLREKFQAMDAGWCRCRSNRPAMEQLSAFLRAAPVEGETEEEMATKRSVGTPGPQGPQEQNVFLRADLNILLDDDREHHRGQPNPHLRAIRAVPQVPHGEGRQGHPSQQSAVGPCPPASPVVHGA